MIYIINYGVGNLNSISNIIKKVGGESEIISDVSLLKQAKKIILPGVGAFDHAMKKLAEHGWTEELTDTVVNRKIPTLGICLGMQMLCKKSEEGVLPGLGWIDAEVKKFNFPEGTNLKVPHMGWNQVHVKKENPLIKNPEEEHRFYFVHSYHVVCNNEADILGTTNYGIEFTSSVSHDNIYGAQFHPEKSHRFGMELLKNFIDIPC
ncbi:MAG: imidazole glycerol phosphate synthase subunit HisH [Ignavibacteria bacterium]|nr:imidazole glycerol phosphate synthase subunit HisH [Ignavibacteria bacterium]